VTDAEFLHALESCGLAPAEFGHAGHVRAGYLYLRSQDFVAALVSVRTAIRRYRRAQLDTDRARRIFVLPR
jgi:hypothetical protein